MEQVEIIFHGVCTHFVGIVPGVAQRVVLPDASTLRFGYLKTPEEPQAAYFLMPHFPILRMLHGAHEIFNVPNVIEHGNIIDGVHLQIPNSVGAMRDEPLVKLELPQLPTYVHHFAYSTDVVLGGRAAAYFDLFHAEQQDVVFVSGAMDTVVTITTDGPPLLRATPFAGGKSYDFPLLHTTGEPLRLWVANQGMDCDTEENNYDFLLHFLTAQMGIPRVLLLNPPGLIRPETFSQQTLNAAADVLKNIEYPVHFDSPCFQLQVPEEPSPFIQILITSPACSNATYP